MPISEDKETLNLFIQESQDHLDGIEDDLLAIEQAGADLNEELVNKVFRAVHSIKGGAGFLGLNTVKELAHNSENVMGRIRGRELVPDSSIISTLLDAIDTLSSLINRYESSNEVDISSNLTALNAIYTGNRQPPTAQAQSPPAAPAGGAPSSLEPAAVKAAPGPATPGAAALLKIDQTVIEAHLAKASFVYILQYHDHFKQSEDPSQELAGLIEEIKGVGEIIAANIDLEDLASARLGAAGDLLLVVVATILEKDLLATFIHLEPERIRPVTAEDLRPAVATAEPARPAPPAAPALPARQEAPPVAAAPPVPAASAAKTEAKPDSLRVNVRLLDNLMTLAGELVLTRNQLVQAVSSRKALGIDNISQRLNLVTAELQEAIMSTRMQPVGNVFNKFKRIVRDLSKDLGKKTELIIKGEEVELDKTIIETIGDPLTHLVRNSVDHGIEMPDQRLAAGKPAAGILRITAYHEGGQVMIAIEDDGAGINVDRVKEKVLAMGLREAAALEELSAKELAKLIFLPGISTAQQLSDVSGRGVGMDVVLTNISKVGGTVDIDTTTGKGSLITIKLPLTLAIIPSLIITVHEERYAIPQVNLVELVRIPAAKVKEKVEKIGSALVMRLRGDLLPLVKLSDALGIGERYFISGATGEQLPERRVRTADRRRLHEQAPAGGGDLAGDDQRRNFPADRRVSPLSAYNILVVSAGDYHYGLIVDQLLDSEEIVVKPLGTHLRDCKCYAGASVQGDGRVALILDIVGISNVMNLRTVAKSVQDQGRRQATAGILHDIQSLLIVRNAPNEQIAIPLDLISRIELSRTADIEITGGQKNIKYRGSTLPLFSINEVARLGSPDSGRPNCYIIIFSISGKEVGIIMSEIIDIIQDNFVIDEMTHKQPGIMGSAIIMNEITLLVDLYGVIDTLMPEWTKSLKGQRQELSAATILVVEDSPFFLNQFVMFLNEAGHKTVTATDGLEGLAVLAREKVDLVITDIEMPRMDGLEMTEKIRADQRFRDLPIIAVTSLAGEAAEKKAQAAGINDYLVKLDREKIIASLNKHLVRV